MGGHTDERPAQDDEGYVSSARERRCAERHGHAGSPVNLTYTVTDDSGEAAVLGQLYQGGTRVQSLGSETPVKADGNSQTWTVRLGSGLKGPLYFCARAQDAAGNKSAGSPKSSCAWIRWLVGIKAVSNGCGGSGWGKIGTVAQNYLGNTSVYKNSNMNPVAASYTVDFTEACDLHDAGYAGVMVDDAINGGPPIDFRTWSRARVDQKFLADMRTLCRAKIPADAAIARANCEARGGTTSIGALSRFTFVDDYGDLFFDADLTMSSNQEEGNPRLRPAGGARANGPPKCNVPGVVGLVHRKLSTRC